MTVRASSALNAAVPARSALFTPAHMPRMVDRALGSDADVLLLDLEDAVPQDSKTEGRAIASGLSQARSVPGLLIRVNGPESGLLVDDLEAVVQPWLAGVLLPKAESRDHLAVLDYLLAHFERRRALPVGHIDIWVSIETARGVTHCEEILAASPRVSGVLVGVAEGGDLHRGLGSRWSPEGLELLYVRSHVLTVARALGVLNVIEGPYVRHADDPGLRREATAARRLGFSGKAAIHPRQVATINEVFSPDPEEVAYARRVVEAMEDAIARGLGATTVDGNMVDVAMLELARRTLERAGAAAKIGDGEDSSR